MRDLIVRDIDALEDKLNVKRQVSDLTDNAVDTVKGKLGMNSNPNESWVDFARHNAAPLALVGLGGAVLAKNVQSRVASSTHTTSSSQSQYFDPSAGSTYSEDSSEGLRDKVGSKLSGMGGTASDGVDTAKDKVMETGQAVGGQVVQAKDMVIERIPSKGEAKQMARDHGQMLGVAALAAGAVAGAFVPRSKAEERRVAPLQSTVKDKAGELAEQGVEKAKETAERASEALSTGVETAKEEFADSGEDEPPATSGTSSTDLPDLTQPNRITGSRNGVTGTPSGSNL
jgi:hypothetical protein